MAKRNKPRTARPKIRTRIRIAWLKLTGWQETPWKPAQLGQFRARFRHCLRYTLIGDKVFIKLSGNVFIPAGKSGGGLQVQCKPVRLWGIR